MLCSGSHLIAQRSHPIAISTTMATSCTFHGLVGIQNASRYQYDNKHYWKYDGYIALPDSDLAVAVFTFGANTASAEDGIYLMHGHTMIGSAVTDEGTSTHTLHIYANDVRCLILFCHHTYVILTGVTTSRGWESCIANSHSSGESYLKQFFIGTRSWF
jgi:hypothetical protein